MIKTGFVPNNFNTSLLIPIPKKQGTTEPSDFRPISVSSSLNTLFERLLLTKLSWLENTNNCQFGYKRKTSCKSAFFAVNETIQYYKYGKSSMNALMQLRRMTSCGEMVCSIR
jgi:hypothetical protein